MASIAEIADQKVDGLVMNTPSSPAQRLRHARKIRGLSQLRLAEKACVAQSTVGNIEAGTRGLKSSTLELARALEVRPEWLAFGTGAMEVGAPPSPATLDQALAILVQWAMKADDLSRDQIRLLVNRIFDEPQRGPEIIARVAASEDLTV